MAIRYDARQKLINDSETYKNVLKKRGLKYIQHYATPKLRLPTFEEESALTVVERIWTVGDRFYKLASEYYGDPELWWVIAWYNLTPTEADVQLGQSVQIPLPLEQILEYYGV
tara:strand:+ start:147 stop:485 length:339 start_codon:yes stop_codon:yes gene_type:complete